MTGATMTDEERQDQAEERDRVELRELEVRDANRAVTGGTKKADKADISDDAKKDIVKRF